MFTTASSLFFPFHFHANDSSKDTSNSQKLSKGGIPLANGDVLLPKPPPWAYPLWTGQDNHNDRMSRSASQAIDQAMAQLWDAKVKFVRVNFSVEMQSESAIDHCSLGSASESYSNCREVPSLPLKSDDIDSEWVRVVLTVDPGVRMEDIVDQEPPRKKEHRRVPSTVAIEEVKVTFISAAYVNILLHSLSEVSVCLLDLHEMQYHLLDKITCNI